MAAIALVGSQGTVATGTTSASPTFGQATTAGNFLVAWAVAAGANNVSTPSGWSTWQNSPGHSGANLNVMAFYKANCGAGETAPTLSATSATFTAGMLSEFSGVPTSGMFDSGQTFSWGNLSASPTSFPANQADAPPGGLHIFTEFLIYTMAATKTTSLSFNNGSIVGNQNNDGTSIATHYRFGYSIATSIAAAASLTVTYTTTNFTEGAGSMHDSVMPLHQPPGILSTPIGPGGV